jgi:hypothetical protein
MRVTITFCDETEREHGKYERHDSFFRCGKAEPLHRLI